MPKFAPMKTLAAALLVCLVILSQPLAAQPFTQTLRGTVQDAESKAPLEGATVQLLLGDSVLKGAYSDAEGRFKITEVPAGRYDLRVAYLGYEPGGAKDVRVNSGKEVVLTLELREAVIDMETVTITATQKEGTRNDMVTVSGRQFSIDETRRYAGSWNDPARMATNFAGVMPANDSRNDIIIRGNSPSGVLWRLEGMDIPNPNHFASFGTTGGPVSILNNNVLDNSDFMTGAFPAEYGNALAGVFDLRMRKGNDEQYEFLGQFGFNGLEFMAEGPISKKSGASFLVNYRYSTLELMKELGIEFGTSSQPKYQDLSFNIHVPTEKAGTFSLFGIGGLSNALVLDSERDTADFFGPAGNDIDFGTNTGAVGLKHQILIGEKSYLRTTLAANGSTQTTTVDKIDRATLTPVPFYRNASAQTKLTMSTVFNSKISAKHTLRLGIFADRLGFLLADSLQVDTLSGFRILTDSKGGAFLLQPYAQWKWRIVEKWTFNVGVHGQFFTQNGTYSVEPRVGIQWRPADRHGLGLAYGEHSQLQPLYVYVRETPMPDGSYTKTNEELDFTRSRHFIFNYDWSVLPTLRFKAEAYYQQLRGVPVEAGTLSSYSILNEGSDYVVSVRDSLKNAGTGQNYGLEFTVEKFFGRGYYFLVTGSLFQSTYAGSDGIQRSTQFNNNYTLTALGGVEQPLGTQKRWVAGLDLRATWSGGRRYTPLDTVASSTSVLAVYDWDNAWTLRFKDYVRVDLRAKIRLNSNKISQELALDISNVLDTQNPLNVVYDVTTRSLRTNYQLGFFPVIQYRIEF